jgi:hypothetical protein
VTTVFDFDPAEHYAALRAVTKQTPLRWLPLGTLLFVGTMVMLSVGLSWERADGWTIIRGALPWALLLIFWLFLFKWLQRRQASVVAKRDPSVRGPQERSVDEQGFRSRGNGVAIEVPWHAIQRAVETTDFFLFFYTWQCAYYVPKRTLSSMQVDETRQHARSALVDRAQLLEG